MSSIAQLCKGGSQLNSTVFRNWCKFDKREILVLMQSFIVNVPEDKAAFFLQLIEELDYEILELEEDDEGDLSGKPVSNKGAAPEINDPFLDWDEERKSAKKNRYK